MMVYVRYEHPKASSDTIDIDLSVDPIFDLMEDGHLREGEP